VISLPALSAPTPTSTSTLTPPLAPVFPVPCSLSYSYEVYDSSNVTHVFVTGTVAQGRSHRDLRGSCPGYSNR
jgi:hypothetical protein